MPIYGYACTCGWKGDITTTIGERDNMACPRDAAKLTRLLSAPRFRIMGQITPGGGPDKFTADMLGIPLKELPEGLKTKS